MAMAKTMKSSTNVCILTCIVFLALAQFGAAADAATDATAAVTRVKRMYALCPPHFVRIGQQCYFLSTTKQNWLDAHFECKDRNSQLAEPVKLEDRRLRRYMQRNDTLHSVKWIGGLFNWQKNQWQWGYSGRDMDYQSFSQMIPGSSQDLKFNCAVLNAVLKYRWSAKPCVEKHNFVCQHKMPYVSEHNRHKFYAKWNASYPNEMANEMEVILDDRKDGDRRRFVSHNGAIRANKVDLLAAPPVTQTSVPTVFKQPPQKRRPNRFNNTLIDSNGRFADRKISQSVDFGAPNNGRRAPFHRRRPKATATNTSSTTPAASAAEDVDRRIELDNRLDVGTDQRNDAEKHHRQVDAQRRDKHRREKLERQQRNRERRLQNEKKRQLKHEKLMREGEQRERAELTTVAPPVLTAEQQREEQRLAETRRMLGIDNPQSRHHQPDRNNAASITTTSSTTATPTTSSPLSTTTTTTTSTPTTTTTAEPPTVDAESNNIRYDYDAERRELEERRIRVEEERQRLEFERRQQEYDQQQAEFKRQERVAAEQRERDRTALLEKRDRDERAQLEQEQRIQSEIRERKEHERLEEEERQREQQLRHEREETRKHDEEERRRTKQAKEAEIRRLKEKATRNNDTGANEVVHSAEEELAELERRKLADAAQQKAQLEKKLKRDKFKKKLMMMTHEQQMEFLAIRAENKQKRQAAVETNSNNEAVIPK